MAFKPQTALVEQSQKDLENARIGLNEALADEAAAESERRDAEAAIVLETGRAAQSTSDGDVERFARWLKRGRFRLATAEAKLAEAVSATAYKRAVLTLARTAYRVATPLSGSERREPSSGSPGQKTFDHR